MTTLIVLLLFVAGTAWVLYKCLHEWLTSLRSVFFGERAEGRCVRSYGTEGSDGFTRMHHVYGFTTADGRAVEFEEPTMLMREGKKVTVRYQAEDPERTATVMGPRTLSPLLGGLFGILVSGSFFLVSLVVLWLYVTEVWQKR
ncbi:DUF3592 domain-containing protein [Streptomyces roseoverticillatus]|uniref:DUF3592 domain-containing protein n=1 Tax=Streptomyces roseoverticillatus TaxID=66429 RepID=UPI001F3788B4|nr:DUF3592 domain-containing protein [Streptomyces roseoverticillatus]MCF3105631.1 DUF3592 domain-containing protein [Streptomyces roseoverticillatus]